VGGEQGREGITVVTGVHAGEGVGGGFVMGADLFGDPVHEEAVAETSEHAQKKHGARLAHPGSSRWLPSRDRVGCATGVFGIDKGFHQYHRMPIPTQRNRSKTRHKVRDAKFSVDCWIAGISHPQTEKKLFDRLQIFCLTYSFPDA
jgi:hypothetical protein